MTPHILSNQMEIPREQCRPNRPFPLTHAKHLRVFESRGVSALGKLFLSKGLSLSFGDLYTFHYLQMVPLFDTPLHIAIPSRERICDFVGLMLRFRNLNNLSMWFRVKGGGWSLWGHWYPALTHGPSGWWLSGFVAIAEYRMWAESLIGKSLTRTMPPCAFLMRRSARGSSVGLCVFMLGE